jgi:hypothetical protein
MFSPKKCQRSLDNAVRTEYCAVSGSKFQEHCRDMRLRFTHTHVEVQQDVLVPDGKTKRDEYFRMISICLSALRKCKRISWSSELTASVHNVTLNVPRSHVRQLGILNDILTSTNTECADMTSQSTASGDAVTCGQSNLPGSIWALAATLSLLLQV